MFEGNLPTIGFLKNWVNLKQNYFLNFKHSMTFVSFNDFSCKVQISLQFEKPLSLP